MKSNYFTTIVDAIESVMWSTTEKAARIAIYNATLNTIAIATGSVTYTATVDAAREFIDEI